MSENARKILFQYAYKRSLDQDATQAVRHRVVIIGAGPVGLSLAIDLAQRGVASVLIDDSDRIGEGSRAICFAKKTLEIFDQLGVAKPMLEKGVIWQVGKVFCGKDQLYEFNLLPEAGHKMPAFINLQQYYVEKHLVDRALELPLMDLRWCNRLVGIKNPEDHVSLKINTPDGDYEIEADYVIACDGARSPTRDLLGLKFKGEIFEDQFLIADVKMTADFPTERWFWFNPPFHNGQSALLHRQPDNIWRIDLQLDRTANATLEQKPEQVIPRIERMLGHSDFDLEWVSIYRFQCRRLERFKQGSVIFAGDSAHQVSPFGARGANSGIQDAQNLGWKLAAVLQGTASAVLLDSYDHERGQAADENILHSTRATDFLAPHSPAERILRDAVLDLAPKAEFARRMVNSGRLSVASFYTSRLSTDDSDAFSGGPAPGAPIPDVPLQHPDGRRVYLSELCGNGFSLIYHSDSRGPPVSDIRLIAIGTGEGEFGDLTGLFEQRFNSQPGTAYLVRPDGHVAARFRQATSIAIDQAAKRALGDNS